MGGGSWEDGCACAYILDCIGYARPEPGSTRRVPGTRYPAGTQSIRSVITVSESVADALRTPAFIRMA